MRWGLLSVVMLAGCGFESAGTGDDFSLVEDSSAPPPADTGVAAMPDTTVTTDPDTAMSSPDTSSEDSAVADSVAPIDSGPLDTGPPDTGPPAMPVLTATSAVVTNYYVNLTTEGTRDWGHWGHTMTNSFQHKSDGMLIAKGGNSGATAYDSPAFRFTWTNGAPDVSVMTTARGLQLDAMGDSFNFDAKGDPATEYRLLVWTSGYLGNGVMTATLSDMTSLTTSTPIGSGGTLVTYRYRPKGEKGTIKIELKKTDSAGYIAVFAAAVQ